MMEKVCVGCEPDMLDWEIADHKVAMEQAASSVYELTN
jgi:hypothetical protein